MEERFCEILEQYDIKVCNVTRIRSGFLIDAEKDCYLLKRAEGGMRRLEYEEQVCTFLSESGCPQVDCPVRNKEELLLTEDSQGEAYVLKEWYRGEECGVRDREALAAASANLARLHRILKETDVPDPPACNEAYLLRESMEKHTRELKRVYSYIRGKRQRNELEIGILNSFPAFYEEAEKGTEALKGFPLQELLQKGMESKTLVHGAYTYHNLLFTRQGIATLNFDRGGTGLQVMDLYYFLRKVMEKNDWKLPLGERLIREYNRYNYLGQSEWELLSILLSYPEKYWKILNHYYNNKKSWIASKNMEKLGNVRELEDKKRLFLKEVFSLHF